MLNSINTVSGCSLAANKIVTVLQMQVFVRFAAARELFILIIRAGATQWLDGGDRDPISPFAI